MFPDMSFRHATVARLAGTAFPRMLFSSDAVLTPFSPRARRRTKEAVMRILMRPAAAALLIAAGLLSVPSGNAQVQSPSPGLSDQSPNISDQKLDAAAAPLERLGGLKQDYHRTLAARRPSHKQRTASGATTARAE